MLSQVVFHGPQPGMTMNVVKTEISGVFACRSLQLRGFRLRQVHQPPVHAEVRGHQFGMAVDDGSAKGGILFAIADRLQVPVRFIGIGESIEDMQPFRADEFVTALLSSGNKDQKLK